ncbi:MAG: M50 family metallopeptidase [Candidatus Paceibacterota bacterium]|jgi:regulator of sigma E protease|nr:site-2 protease family protein [bacterium]
MFIVDILIFLFILGLVVMVHELGHFWAAKLTGTRVDEFSIGFPPKIWEKKIGETNYVLGAIPLGGYNKIYGMDTEDEKSDTDKHSYDTKGPWARAFICFNGVFMNIIFAALVFYIIMFAYGFKSYQPLIIDDFHFKFGQQEKRVLVNGISANSPAEKAGIKTRDIILSINGEDIHNGNETTEIIGENNNKEVVLKYLDWATRQEKTVNIIPEYNQDAKRAIVGIGMRDIIIIDYNSPIDKVFSGFFHAYNYIDYSFTAMGYMFNLSVKEKNVELLSSSMTGPVGIFAITKIIVQNGLIEVINLIALLSLALGITNLLPIPAMDGAKLIYIALESINKKIFNKNLQGKIELGGFAILILLAVFLIVKDFIQFKDIIFKL